MIKKTIAFVLIIATCCGCSNNLRRHRNLQRGRNLEKREFTPSLSRIPITIMSRGRSTVKQLSAFAISNNKNVDPSLVEYIAKTYIEEANEEGVNYDIAFCQMCLETGFLSDTFHVKNNNFAGIGVVKTGIVGSKFRSIKIGVRAQIQHLKAYASKAPIKNALEDPRFHYIDRGVAPTIFDLTKRWAADPMYGNKIYNILKRLRSM